MSGHISFLVSSAVEALACLTCCSLFALDSFMVRVLARRDL